MFSSARGGATTRRSRWGELLKAKEGGQGHIRYAQCRLRSAPTAHLVVLYPADNEEIVPERYRPGYLHTQIAARVEGYLAVPKYGVPEARFTRTWEQVLPRIVVSFVTWEQVVEAIDDAALGRFYGLCRRFNGGSG